MEGKLNKRTDNTIITMESLITDLEMTLKLVYSFDNEEKKASIECIGASIYGYDNQVLGAISISALSQVLMKIPSKTTAKK